MKLISPLWLSSIFLCASLCCSGDDDFNSEFFQFEVDNTISVESELDGICTIGDTLWVNTVIPLNLMDTAGDIYNINNLSDNTRIVRHTLSLYEDTGFQNPTAIILAEGEIVEDLGDTDAGSRFISIASVLQNDVYVNRFGIILAAEGDFFLASSNESGLIEVYADSNNNNQIYIETTIEGANPNNQFEFTVVE